MRNTNQPAPGYDIIGDIHGHAKPPVRFSAWGYPKHLASQLEKNSRVAPPLSLPLCKIDPMNTNHQVEDTGDFPNTAGFKEEP
jgi:hypothetical protein